MPIYTLAVLIVTFGTDFFRGYRSWLNLPFLVYGANIVSIIPGTHTIFPPYFDCEHLWSLALEEQFYSIWPFVVVLVPNRRILLRICTGGILIALTLRVAAAAFSVSPWIAYRELPTRMDSLLAGGMLALAIRGAGTKAWLRPRPLIAIMVSATIGLAVVVAFARSLFFSSRPMDTAGYTLLAMIFTCALALALIPGTAANRIGNLRILRFYGRWVFT